MDKNKHDSTSPKRKKKGWVGYTAQIIATPLLIIYYIFKGFSVWYIAPLQKKNKQMLDLIIRLVLLLIFIVLIIIVIMGLLTELWDIFLEYYNILITTVITSGAAILAAFITKAVSSNKSTDANAEATLKSNLIQNIFIKSSKAIAIGALLTLLICGVTAVNDETKRLNTLDDSVETETPVEIDSPIGTELLVEPRRYVNFGKDAIFVNHRDCQDDIYEALMNTFRYYIFQEAAERASSRCRELTSEAEDKYADALERRYEGMEKTWRDDPEKYANEISQWLYSTANDPSTENPGISRQDEWIAELHKIIALYESALIAMPGYYLSYNRLRQRYIDIADAYQQYRDNANAKKYRQEAQVTAALALKYAIINKSDQNKRNALNNLIRLYVIPKGLENEFQDEQEDIENIHAALFLFRDTIELINPRDSGD